MRLQAKRAEEVELNLISLVDVVLLLVIFFMVSTTFVEEGRLRVELPQASPVPVAAPQDPIVVTVTAQGSYRVNEQGLVNNAPETLRAAVAKAADGRRDVPLTIRADARAHGIDDRQLHTTRAAATSFTDVMTEIDQPFTRNRRQS